jgi:hypothetical protein
VVGVNPDHPTPVTPIRGLIGPGSTMQP